MLLRNLGGHRHSCLPLGETNFAQHKLCSAMTRGLHVLDSCRACVRRSAQWSRVVLFTGVTLCASAALCASCIARSSAPASQVHSIGGDGNCMFRALIQSRHYSLRALPLILTQLPAILGLFAQPFGTLWMCVPALGYCVIRSLCVPRLMYTPSRIDAVCTLSSVQQLFMCLSDCHPRSRAVSSLVGAVRLRPTKYIGKASRAHPCAPASALLQQVNSIRGR
jgi:hypothetical protein